ncbi:hypothetical protein HD806DRAFT_494956 [Xylariaceae sp. AK1471]|nr:hypothetical protein HD806DRAFT_494956 [Xylariaceae sp. AK1471]
MFVSLGSLSPWFFHSHYIPLTSSLALVSQFVRWTLAVSRMKVTMMMATPKSISHTYLAIFVTISKILSARFLHVMLRLR